VKTTIAALMLACLSHSAGAQEACSKLSVSDAAALSQEQLARRVCEAENLGRTALAEHPPSQLSARIASRCVHASVDNNALYKERFGQMVDCGLAPTK
jgi:hypothetical protein